MQFEVFMQELLDVLVANAIHLFERPVTGTHARGEYEKCRFYHTFITV